MSIANRFEGSVGLDIKVVFPFVGVALTNLGCGQKFHFITPTLIPSPLPTTHDPSSRAITFSCRHKLHPLNTCIYLQVFTAEQVLVDEHH